MRRPQQVPRRPHRPEQNRSRAGPPNLLAADFLWPGAPSRGHYDASGAAAPRPISVYKARRPRKNAAPRLSPLVTNGAQSALAGDGGTVGSVANVAREILQMARRLAAGAAGESLVLSLIPECIQTNALVPVRLRPTASHRPQSKPMVKLMS